MKKRKFGDVVLFITNERVNPCSRHEYKEGIITYFFKGKIKGITEMDNGVIFYHIEGSRYDLYRMKTREDRMPEIYKVPELFCFDTPNELISKVKEILN